MTESRRALVPAIGLALALVLGACTSSTAPAGGDSASAAGSSGPAPSDAPAPTVVPGSSVASSPDAPVTGGGGGTVGNPGTILDPDQLAGIFDPAPAPDGEPMLVAPVANARDLHDVNATKVETAIDGRTVAVRVSWWSGVEPCTVLAGVDVTRGAGRITLTVREGSAAQPDTFCTEQAVYKAVVVSLGELEPGSWTIVATGDAPPVTIEIAG